MNSIWTSLKSPEDLDRLVEHSFQQPALIFKHSTTCGISHSVFSKVEQELEQLADKYTLYYLDLLANRSISNEVADRFNVLHQSPQVLVIHQGQAVYNKSHHAINPKQLQEIVLE